MAPIPSEIEAHNTPINPNTIRALRHILSAVANLQTVSTASQSEQVLLGETHLLLRENVRRLAGVCP